MPIRPEERDRYPDNWAEIRESILARAENRCEQCGVTNHALGWRDSQGEFHEYGPCEAEAAKMDGEQVLRIVLTIAHLDHQPENNDPSNLRAWCQKCHNTYDAPMRAAGRRRRQHQDNLELQFTQED